MRGALSPASGPALLLILTAASLMAFMSCHGPLSAEPHPRSILVLDQSETTSPFYYAIFSGLRSAVTADRSAPVSVYLESVDLDRFSGPGYEASLAAHLKSKYSDRPPGVLVPVGATALEFALRLRAQLWPNVPVVFCMVDEATLARLSPGYNVTGNALRLRLSDMMVVARALVPDLKHIAVVGDAWDRQTVFGHFEHEIAEATAGVELIDLVGLPLTDVRRRVAALPQATAILYTAMYSDGAGTSLLAREALAGFADVANAPIVGAAETFVGAGATGGLVMQPGLIGSSAGQLAMRIINGVPVAQIPVTMVDAVRPVFDWRQMRRWGVSEAALPPGSQIRFRESSAWDRYRWEIVVSAAVMLLQAVLIIGLLYQRRRRRVAEVDARQRMAELAHVNRHATVGQLSAAIAHELNQPLGAILNNVEAAAMLVAAPSRNDQELREILSDIKRDDQRASEVLKRLRRLLSKGSVEAQELDINEVVRDVFGMLSAQAMAHDVKLIGKLAPMRLWIMGDRVQLEQVILNLVVNAIDAISATSHGVREIVCSSWDADGHALVAVRDSGPGIPLDQMEQLFEPFSTTKAGGMGMGLCIARTIIEAHGGKISAETRASGAVFHISLPLTRSRWKRA